MDPDISLIQNYSDEVQLNVLNLLSQNKLSQYLETKYPESHNITSNKLLFDYTQSMKKLYMKKSSPLHKVIYDDTIEKVYAALGFNKSSSRVQGKKLKTKNEIRIASVFKKAPLELLNMIIIHELAHLKEMEHNKKFYTLCRHMDPDYFQLEFDMRLYLINLENP